MNSFKFTLFIFFTLKSILVFSGGDITIKSSVPSDITICGTEQTVTLTINNPSPFLLKNIKIIVQFPLGILYSPGSVTNAAEFNLSNPDSIVFALPDMATLTSQTITYKLKADCELIPYLASGNRS